MKNIEQHAIHLENKPPVDNNENIQNAENIEKVLKNESQEIMTNIMEKLRNLNENSAIYKIIKQEFSSLEEYSKDPINCFKLLDKILTYHEKIFIEKSPKQQITAEKLIEELKKQEFSENFNDIEQKQEILQNNSEIKNAENQEEILQNLKPEIPENSIKQHKIAETVRVTPSKSSISSKQRKFASVSTIKIGDKNLSGWYDAMGQKSVIGNIGKNQTVKLKQVYNNYTKKTTGYFDPELQYGGKSVIYNEEKGRGSRYSLAIEDFDEPKNRILQEKPCDKIKRDFPERPGWISAREYFLNNGTDSPSHRSRSPDKITSPQKIIFP